MAITPTPGPQAHGWFWDPDCLFLAGYISNGNNCNATEVVRLDNCCGLSLRTGVLTLPAGSESAPSLTFNCDTNTGLFQSDDALSLVAGAQEFLTLSEAGSDELVVNTDGDDIDFRVESDCVTNLLLVDAGADNIKIAGTAAHATTPGTQSISMFAGTAPNGTLACGATLFAGCDTCVIEIRAEDSGGTATTL